MGDLAKFGPDMAEELIISKDTNKAKAYQTLQPQLEALVMGEPNLVANLANLIAALKQTFDFFWVGIYVVDGDELVLGPFQGPIACTRITKGKGVCGSSFAEKTTLIVPDVDAFPGHIACSGDSRSEIVVPVIKDGKVIMVIDVDSNELDAFDEIDREYLEAVAQLISTLPGT